MTIGPPPIQDRDGTRPTDPPPSGPTEGSAGPSRPVQVVEAGVGVPADNGVLAPAITKKEHAVTAASREPLTENLTDIVGPPVYKTGVLAKYTKLVGSAANGAVCS